MSFSIEVRASDSAFVETIYWGRSDEYPDTFTSIAVSHWEMVVTRYRGETYLTVRGPETRATPAPIPEGAEFLGIVFSLGTYMPHLPLSELVDNELILPGAADQSFWLKHSTWQFPNYNNADVFADRLIREGLLERDPVVVATMRNRPQELSLRTVQRHFSQATGLTQNTLYQIERSRRAMALLEQGESIFDVVHEAGYYDQPHLTRSLKRFIGRTPGEIRSVSQSQ